MRRLLLGMAFVAAAMLMPTTANADDHQIAEYIKNRLQVEQQNGNLRGFNVDMRVDRGTVWFKGYVSNAAQEQLILSTAQKAGYLGVVQVVDDIEIQTSSAAPAMAPASSEYYAPASYQEPALTVRPQVQTPVQATTNVYNSGTPLAFAQAGTQQVPATQASTPIPSQPIAGPTAGPMGGPMAAPMGGGNMMGGTPNLPGYSWPGYAASPNYAAVSYPRQYSPSAWPYIGPFYPYPQVPLGWRRVELEWDDGWWFLDFHDK